MFWSEVMIYCVCVSPNHSRFTAWLCNQGQRNPCAVLLLEQVEIVSLGHPATGSEQEGKLCRTWAEELELPLAEQNELAWSMATAGTSEIKL